MLIVEHPTVTEMQSSKKSAVASLDFVSKCNVGYSLMIIYILLVTNWSHCHYDILVHCVHTTPSTETGRESFQFDFGSSNTFSLHIHIYNCCHRIYLNVY